MVTKLQEAQGSAFEKLASVKCAAQSLEEAVSACVYAFPQASQFYLQLYSLSPGAQSLYLSAVRPCLLDLSLPSPRGL